MILISIQLAFLHLGGSLVSGRRDPLKKRSFKDSEMNWDKADSGFVVVVNHEEQYSIWPDYKVLPEGWRAVGQQGDKAQCLTWIEQNWTDMRPLSLRLALQSADPR